MSPIFDDVDYDNSNKDDRKTTQLGVALTLNVIWLNLDLGTGCSSIKFTYCLSVCPCEYQVYACDLHVAALF
jgi:hypothetical protein